MAFPSLKDATRVPPPEPARILEPDVAIIGGGAGGLSAAIAAPAGRRVGGRSGRTQGRWRAVLQAIGQPATLDAQQAEGADLLRQAQDSGAEIIGSAEVWGAFDGPLFLADVEGRALVVRPKTAIIATGAYERPAMVPGWTLPGVMTTGAAQTLWRSYRTLPGKRVAVCGSGPAERAGRAGTGGGRRDGRRRGRSGGWALAASLDGGQGARCWTPALVRKGSGHDAGSAQARGIPLAYRPALHRIEQSDDALRVTFRDSRRARDVGRRRCGLHE